MSSNQRFLKIYAFISVLTLAALTIAACSGSSSVISNQVNNGQITICHATDNATNPYDRMTVDFNVLTAHIDHKNDLIPASAGGCPKTVKTGSNDGKITICHATDSTTNPYNEITIDFNALRGHSNHEGDVISAPEGGCPLVTVTPAISVTPTVTVTPTMTTTPATPTPGNNDGKITICHATGSSKNPYVMITVSVNGLNGHDKHPGDIIPAPAGGCSTK